MNRRNISRSWLFAGLLAFLLSLSTLGCTRVGVQIGGGPTVKSGPPPHAPAHGYRAKHRYHYYPANHVYFDIERKAYFYMEGAAWRMSVSLPDSLRVQLGDHVTIDMEDDRPYVAFEEHKKKYPPGQAKKKWKKK
ncbi:MAG: hypothetical protein KKE57_11665 [Proteobacteria bacterium]|nr:hypothetical protein [Pseudomonadota bacterium]